MGKAKNKTRGAAQHPVHGYPVAPVQDVRQSRRNARERARVSTINNGYKKLRRHIPSSNTRPHIRMSKIDILTKAIDYIGSLQEVLSNSSVNKNSILVNSQEEMTLPIQGSMSSTFGHNVNQSNSGIVNTHKDTSNYVDTQDLEISYYSSESTFNSTFSNPVPYSFENIGYLPSESFRPSHPMNNIFPCNQVDNNLPHYSLENSVQMNHSVNNISFSVDDQNTIVPYYYENDTMPYHPVP